MVAGPTMAVPRRAADGMLLAGNVERETELDARERTCRKVPADQADINAQAFAKLIDSARHELKLTSTQIDTIRCRCSNFSAELQPVGDCTNKRASHRRDVPSCRRCDAHDSGRCVADKKVPAV